MRPTILYEGKGYPVLSIDWHEDGKLASVTFRDENKFLHTAFCKMPFDREGYNSYGNLQLDLEKYVKWGESNAIRN